MKANNDAKIYRKQMIEFAKESKQSIKIDGKLIMDEPNDAELGKIIRSMYLDVCNEADERIKYLENQK